MKFGVIMSSELGDRWDAGFHLLRKEYESMASHLEKTMTKQEIVDILSDKDMFPTSYLACIAPLARGSHDTRDSLIGAIDEYPFLAMAIVLDKTEPLLRLQQQKEAIDRRIAVFDSFLDQISNNPAKGNAEQSQREPSSPALPGLSSIPDDLREMLTTHRFVAGVAHLDGNEVVIPAQTSGTAYVADCWVIDAEDWKGIETIEALIAEGNVPVPRRHEDMGAPVGYVDLPGHEHNYGRGWRR